VYEHWVGSDATRRRHIFKMPISGGTPVDLTPNEQMVTSPMWRRIVGSSN
jgi:hypothetical protein